MPKIKLYMIPHAGGSAMGYMTMKRFIDPEHVELVPLELAGRGRRMKEVCHTSIEEDVYDLYAMIKEQIKGEDYAIFGHSLGTLITYELVKKIQKEKERMPKCVFFSGGCAPYYRKLLPVIGDVSDEEFVSKFGENQALPKEILANKELLAMLLPVLRADVKKSESYVYVESEKINTDVVCFYGSSDALANEEAMEKWKTLATGSFLMKEFDGGHFYYSKHREEVGEAISNILKKYRI